MILSNDNNLYSVEDDYGQEINIWKVTGIMIYTKSFEIF